MKKKYEVPVLEVIGFESEDIITTSPVDTDSNMDNTVDNTDALFE